MSVITPSVNESSAPAFCSINAPAFQTGLAPSCSASTPALLFVANTCTGQGLIGCVPDAAMDDGGINSIGDSLEVYCQDNVTRLCLSGERCPWRKTADARVFPAGVQTISAVKPAMTCSPYGLELDPNTSVGNMATIYGPNNTKQTINCDANGNVTAAMNGAAQFTAWNPPSNWQNSLSHWFNNGSAASANGITPVTVAKQGVTYFNLSDYSNVSNAVLAGKDTAYPEWGYMYDGTFIEYTLHVPAAGKYWLALQYESASANSQLSISANGVQVGAVALQSAAGYSTAASSVPVAVTLPSGNVILRLTVVQNGFNISGIALMSDSSAQLSWENIVASPEPSVDPAKVMNPAATAQVVSAVSTTHLNLSDYKDYYNLSMAGINTPKAEWGYAYDGGFVEYTINVSQAQAYNISVSFATDGDYSAVNILVNNTVQNTSYLPDTGSWTNFSRSAPVTLNLQAGVNVLQIKVENNGLNIGGIAITPAPSNPCLQKAQLSAL